MKIIECDQGTPEWWAARCGIPTASQFSKIITPVKGEPSTSWLDYACQLIADIAMGGPPEGVESMGNRHTRHGQETEAAARA